LDSICALPGIVAIRQMSYVIVIGRDSVIAYDTYDFICNAVGLSGAISETATGIRPGDAFMIPKKWTGVWEADG
jgi:hypothetical protein